MALTDEQIEKLADDYLVGIYQRMEKDVLQDIARRVRKTDRFTETAEIMARNMHEQGYSTAQIYAEVMRILQADPEYIQFVAENTKAYKAEVTEIIKETTRDAKKAGNELVAEAGDMAFNNDMSMWELAGQDLSKPNNMTQIINSFQKDLNGQLKNLTGTTGFKGTILGTTGVKQAYQRALDTALLEVSTGTFSFDEAVNKVVTEMAHSGLRSIDYASGRSYQLDTSARMCVRTSMNQMAGRITEANCKSSRVDLVIVSQHEGARPEHADVENKVFCMSGKSDKYPDFSDPLPCDGGEGAGYGDAAGICGVNCRHTFYPFWEGISEIPEPLETWEDKEVDGKIYDYYDATQHQRSMEREIRALKREEYVADQEHKAEIDRKIKAKTQEYHRFSEEVGIRPKDNRLRVVA